jgi:isopentenyl-diphosphate delta-isomerase
MEYVVLVDEHDNEVGTMEKLLAHQQGILHRAISVFIFNDNRELLLQRRALGKYHSGGLWTNTCCSHPKPGEDAGDAASRRLFEEMGIVADIQTEFTFLYRTTFENGLTEHELDHVFSGTSNDIPQPDPDEVMEWKYLSIDAIIKEIEAHPEQFSYWFKLIVKEHRFKTLFAQ